MHVLVTADTVGGVWTYTRELVTGLARRGARVTLVSFGEIPASPQTDWLDGLRGVDFRPTAFRLEWMQDAPDDLEASSDFLMGVVKETRPDLLHLNQFCYGALETDIPKIVVAHSDVVSWWVAVHGEEPRDTRWLRWYRETVSRGLRSASAVVAPSRCMLQNVAAHYLKPSQSAVIYNGRNPGLFNPHGTKDEMVLSVGRLWDGGKQVSLLAERDHKIEVCIAGTEQHPDQVLRGATPAIPPRRNVQFRGKQSEAQLVQLYGRASMYAATSRYEPFGLAAVEAALSRCAILANDIPSFHEIWGDTAVYFRYNDAESLAQQIQRLHDDRELRLTYSNLAYHRARARCTAERMVDDYMNLYQSLVPAGAAVA